MAETNEVSSASADAAHSRVNRRRAKKACFACNARKVRCDVVRRGIPCTNCEDDHAQCTIRERKNKRIVLQPPPSDNARPEKAATRQTAASDAPKEPAVPVLHDSTVRDSAQYQDAFDQPSTLDTLTPMQPWDFNSDFQAGTSPLSGGLDLSMDLDFQGLMGLENVFNMCDTMGTAPLAMDASDNWSLSSPETAKTPGQVSVTSAANDQASPMSTTLPWESVAESVVGTTEDKTFLQSQGCFHLPATPILRQLMMNYYQFVHPNLPIIDEAGFWGLWNGSNFRLGAFSVLVIQAMAFAASSFASDDVLSSCGFSNGRKARLSLYRKAKLLYDFDVERNPVCMSQASLLLTYYAPNHNHHRVNSQWLSNAIRYAQIARADKFYEFPIESPKYATLKRLWWCCILRDRIMPLGVRRGPQIETDVPDSVGNKFLSHHDFTNEHGASLVHDVGTQSRIFQIIEQACRLAETLTPTIKMLYATENLAERAQSTPSSIQVLLQQVKGHLRRLYQWHEAAIRIFPSPVSLGDTHDTVSVFANLLFIYFDAAVIALCQHAMMLWEARSNPQTNLNGMYESPAAEIMRAVADTTDRTKELVQAGLAKYLPISASAFLTLPLLLHALNVRAAAGSSSEVIERRQLEIYTMAMKLQQTIYDGTDFCYDLVSNILAYTEDDSFIRGPSMTPTRSASEDRPSAWKYSSKASSVGKTTGMMGWEDLLHKKPRLFLRLAMHLDVAFCAGAAPQEEDFPRQLRRSRQPTSVAVA